MSDALEWLIEHEPGFRKSAYLTALMRHHSKADPADTERAYQPFTPISVAFAPPTRTGTKPIFLHGGVASPGSCAPALLPPDLARRPIPITLF